MLDNAHQIVLRMIERAAASGDKCPTNADIAEAIQSASVGTSARIVGQLEKRGLIEVKRFGASRIVTVVATGAITAGLPGKQHWSARGKKPQRPKSDRKYVDPLKPDDTPQVDPVRTERTVCFYCGTNSSVGCRHIRPEAA